MTETRIVRSVRASTTAAALVTPWASGIRYVTPKPSDSRRRHGSRTARCSIADVTTWAPGAWRARVAPRIARLFDSVAPDVNTISRGFAPTNTARASRAFVTAASARQPKTWL